MISTQNVLSSELINMLSFRKHQQKKTKNKKRGVEPRITKKKKIIKKKRKNLKRKRIPRFEHYTTQKNIKNLVMNIYFSVTSFNDIASITGKNISKQSFSTKKKKKVL
jgi:hypothetical protein